MVFINKINLTNFRCYKKIELEFSNHINILVGNNAVGKTSIVEAVHCLGFAKSHKASVDSEMILKGENFAIIKADFVKDDRNDQIIISFTDKGKRIQHNNKTYNNLSEYIGFLNVVIFCPEDLDIIKGSPANRRKFLDSNISQISNRYLISSIRYKKLLKQRNEILKNINENQKYDYDLLKIVTDGLMNEAKVIITERKKFINLINPYLIDKCQAISEMKEMGKIKYVPNMEENNLVQGYEESLKRDIMLKTTTCGPHRDDFLITINGENAATYSSQGQQRTISLAIKLALADLIKAQGQNLVIILDDVFSELDINRQNEILRLMNKENQIFITTTTIANLSEDIINNSKVVMIHKEEDENE